MKQLYVKCTQCKCVESRQKRSFSIMKYKVHMNRLNKIESVDFLICRLSLFLSDPFLPNDSDWNPLHVCLFVWFFTSHQQSFSYTGTNLPGLNQY